MNEFALYLVNETSEAIDKMHCQLKNLIAQERKYLRECMDNLCAYHTKMAKLVSKPSFKQLRHLIKNRNRTWQNANLPILAPTISIIILVILF